ncbi:hypothetical protein HHI36_003290 [Cryptolaemus montrouzieri]|uniref:Uncharacterized protein n=1 Tax=Cryptolaemus montrouzieri TaxID=559131 RepID=A0ABD2PCZ6_9CUCU
MSQTESCRVLFNSMNMQTLYGLYFYECVMFVAENYSLFREMEGNHEYDTRNKKCLIQIKTEFTYIQQNVSYMIVTIWNKLPIEFKRQALGKKKMNLRRFLIKNCY